MIELKNLTKKYNDKIIFEKLNILIKDNFINVITGSSGCGKTTLLNIIAGIDSVYDGKIHGMPNDISYLFQEDRLLPFFNVIENVIFTMPDDLEKEKKIELAIFFLDKFELLNDYHKYPHELSGGMSRRVAIARSFAYSSDILLLDEPFNGLNIELKQIVIEAIYDYLNLKNKIIIVVSHDPIIYSENNNQNTFNIIKIVD